METNVGRYMLKEMIGHGAFGRVFAGTDVHTGNAVAIKLESIRAKYPQLKHELKIYRMLTPGTGISSIRSFGTCSGFNYIVLDLLGPSLEEVFNSYNRAFSLKTYLSFAQQMLIRVQYLHSQGIIHRDIKPGNFVLGLGNRRNEVSIIDFGLARKYHDSGGHIPHRMGKKLVGTVRYASVNNHLGHEQSRRDDLESLAYVLYYFFLGHLPWQNPEGATEQQRDAWVLQHKSEFPVTMSLYGCTEGFRAFLEYASALGFDEDPNYFYLHKLLLDLYCDSA